MCYDPHIVEQLGSGLYSQHLGICVCVMGKRLGAQVDWNNIIYPTTVLLAQLTDDKAFHDGAQAYFQKWLCRHALMLRLACSQQRPVCQRSHVALGAASSMQCKAMLVGELLPRRTTCVQCTKCRSLLQLH